jgi:S1-C subfamily serine protease
MSPQRSRAAAASATSPGLSSSLADAVERAAASVVAIHARRRIPSSGIIWRAGVIVSASHTVTRDDDIRITLPNGESAEAPASIVGRDAASDLVVLRFESAPDAAPPAPRADPASLRVGALVLAVGRPGASATASLGIVRAITEGWRGFDGTRLDRAAKLDLAVYDGFSGGSLVDSTGALLGLNNSALTRGSAAALPTPTVDRIVDELLSRGHVPRPFIGVAVQPVMLLQSQAAASGERETRSVLLVTAVGEASPAERAGVIVGDVLLSAAGGTLRRPTDLLDALAERDGAAGGKVELTLLRGGKSLTISVVPADRRATA